MVFNALSVPQVAALLATGNAVIALLSLILGRYWQAPFITPGGLERSFAHCGCPGGAVAMMARHGPHSVVDGCLTGGVERGGCVAPHHCGVCAGARLCEPSGQRGHLVDSHVCIVDRARSSEVGVGGVRRDRRIR